MPSSHTLSDPQPPAVLIELAVEAAPQVFSCCANDSEDERLTDWLVSKPELLDLVCQALELEGAAS